MRRIIKALIVRLAVMGYLSVSLAERLIRLGGLTNE